MAVIHTHWPEKKKSVPVKKEEKISPKKPEKKIVKEKPIVKERPVIAEPSIEEFLNNEDI